MSGNKLVFWLSHLGEGTWETFRKAVEQLAEPQEKEENVLSKLTKALRFRLSDLGFLDFFPQERKRWQMQPPVLASFAESPASAILCGGRSPDLIDGLKSAAELTQCTVHSEGRSSLPDHIIVTGKHEALATLANAIRIRHSGDFAGELIEQLVTIESQLADAQSGQLMIGWRRRYFDLHSCQWTPSELRRTVCECISRYGRTMTFLQISRMKTVILPRREAIYAAAMLSGTSIASYDSDSKTLSAPMHAPLPSACARLACISSGSVGTLSSGSVCYSPVPPRIARIILASVGQSLS